MKHKSIRSQEAVARQAAYAALSPEDKLKQLDQRLGKGQGAAAERARLLKQLIQH